MNSRAMKSGILMAALIIGGLAGPAAAHGGRGERWGRPTHRTVVVTRSRRVCRPYHHHRRVETVSCAPSAVWWALVGGAVIGAVVAESSQHRAGDRD